MKGQEALDSLRYLIDRYLPQQDQRETLKQLVQERGVTTAKGILSTLLDRYSDSISPEDARLIREIALEVL